MADHSGSRYFIRQESYTGENIVYLNKFDGKDDYAFYAMNPIDAIAFEDYEIAEAHAKIIGEDDLEVVEMHLKAVETAAFDIRTESNTTEQ